MSFLEAQAAAAKVQTAVSFWAVLLEGDAGRFWILGSDEAESLVINEPDPFFHLAELENLIETGANAGDVRVIVAAKRVFGARVIGSGPEEDPLELVDSVPPPLPQTHRAPAPRPQPSQPDPPHPNSKKRKTAPEGGQPTLSGLIDSLAAKPND